MQEQKPESNQTRSPREELGAIADKVLSDNPENLHAQALKAALPNLSAEQVGKLLEEYNACFGSKPGSRSQGSSPLLGATHESAPPGGGVVRTTQSPSMGGEVSGGSGGGGPSGPRTAPGSGLGRGRGPEEDLVVNRRSSSEVAGEIERINEELKEILRHGNKSLTPEQTEEWIRLGLERLKLPLFSEKGAQSVVEDPANQIDRLVRTGLVSKDVAEGLGVSDGPKPYDPGYLRTLRGMSVMAWAPTAVVAAGVLAMPVAAGTWNVSDLGAWVMAGVGMVNYGVQELLALRYRNFKKTTIEELKSETGQYVAEREIGALGMMYKLIDQYSPLLIFKDRTDLNDGGYPSSKGAILQHIRDAAQIGCEHGLVNAMQYQAKVKMFEKPLQALMTRWDGHWDTSVSFARVLGAMPVCGLIAKYMM